MVHCSAYNCFEDSRKRKSSGSRTAAAESASVTNDVSDGPSQPRQKSETLFKFPSDPSLQKVWIAKMDLLNFELKTNSRLCQDHVEEDQFEEGPKFIASLGLEGIKHPSLKRNAVPTIFDKGSPKGSGQVKGKRSFKRRTVIKPITSRFQSLFSSESPSPKKLRSKKRYGGFAKRRRLEMIAELVEREEATSNHDHDKQTSIVLTSDAGIDTAESEYS
eukprot:gene10151-18816_t